MQRGVLLNVKENGVLKAFSNRFELKYVLDWQTYMGIKRDLQYIFKPDPLAGKNGKYIVISIYYDTNDLDFFWDKVDGEENRIKIRLRTYLPVDSCQHNDKQIVFLEVKKKKNTVILKRRFLVDENLVVALFKHPADKNIFKSVLECGGQGLEEVGFLNNILHLKPVLVISYDREPFVSTDKFPVRITFDSNVRYRYRNLSLSRQATDKRVLSPLHIIMEIKYTDYFPEWIVKLIQKYNCQARTFSKYCVGMEHSMRDLAYPTGYFK